MFFLHTRKCTTCVHMCEQRVWCLYRLEKDSGVFETGVTVMSPHVDAGKSTRSPARAARGLLNYRAISSGPTFFTFKRKICRKKNLAIDGWGQKPGSRLKLNGQQELFGKTETSLYAVTNHIHLSRLIKWWLKETDFMFVYRLHKFDFRTIMQIFWKAQKRRVKTEQQG